MTPTYVQEAQDLQTCVFARDRSEPAGQALIEVARRLTRDTDPDRFTRNRPVHEEAFQRLMSAAIAKVDIACGTPAMMLGSVTPSNFSPWLSLRSRSTGIQAATAPPTGTRSGRDHHRWPRREETHLLIPKRNHRARYNAAERALETFYGRDMTILYRKPTKATETLRTWLSTTFRARCNTVMVRPKEINETPVGTSYANFGNAHLVIQLIIAMYHANANLNTTDAQSLLSYRKVRVRRGSTMIIAPYAVQELVYQLLWSQLTVDESPSHEADVYFVDLVRTDRPRLVNDQFRLAVAFTGALLG
ncbi:hypothetical protein ACHAP7_012237 [Fusarium lateritium]